MHDGSLTYVVCYDISDDRRRTQLAKCLESFGSRVQWSVFEAFLTRPLVDNLLTRIGEIINSATDSVSLYPLCALCAQKSVFLGTANREERPGKETVFIV